MKNPNAIDNVSKVVRRNDKAYVIASITPVHRPRCPAVRMGKSHGECDCGAYTMMADFMSQAGEAPWILVHQTEERK